MPSGFKDTSERRASIATYAQRVIDYSRWKGNTQLYSDIGNPTPLDRMFREIIQFASGLPAVHTGGGPQEVRNTQWEQEWLKTLNTVHCAMRNNIPDDYDCLLLDGVLMRLALYLVNDTNTEGSTSELNVFQRKTIQTVEQCLETLQTASPVVSTQNTELWMAFKHYQQARQAFERARALHAQWSPQADDPAAESVDEAGGDSITTPLCRGIFAP